MIVNTQFHEKSFARVLLVCCIPVTPGPLDAARVTIFHIKLLRSTVYDMVNRTRIEGGGYSKQHGYRIITRYDQQAGCHSL